MYESHFDGVRTREQLIDAVTDLIHGDAGADTARLGGRVRAVPGRAARPGAAHDHRVLDAHSRAVLERFVDPTTARGVDALIEGLVMHKTLSTAPVSRADIRAIVACLGARA